jgi:peptidase M28-like protein
VRLAAPFLAALIIWAVSQATIGLAAPAQTSGPAARTERPEGTERVDRDALMRAVRTLSQPSFEGRRTGTAGSGLARRFIQDAFRQIGLAPAVPDFLQPFSFTIDRTTGRLSNALPRSAYEGVNVLAMVPGRRAGARTVVISAHYDHLGVVGGKVYPGADDNASGVAAMLAIARYVQRHPLEHRVVFAAFDAEELGLEGAKAFVKTPPVPLTSIALDINFDMVSRNDRNEIYAAGTFQNPSLQPIVADVQRRSAVAIRPGHDRPKTRDSDPDDWTPQSDHGVFDRAGVPFIYFGVEDHADYHKPTDTADKISPAFFGNVADMLLDFVLTADKRLP